MSKAAEVVGVGKRFGNTVALADVSLTIERGSIHALVGRNGAGKSTLVSILTGLVQPDRGSVYLESAPSCVYQHSKIVPHVSVAENIFLNRQPRSRFHAIDWKVMRQQARAMLMDWNVAVQPDAPGSALSVEECQLVEILRALCCGSRFLILDEPTARLEGTAIERLFARLRRLNESGVTMLFISHHLQELYALCDTVTVLRDGMSVATRPTAEFPAEAAIEAMTGSPLSVAQSPAAPIASTAAPVLTVEALCGDGFEDVTFEVRPGESVGLAGIGGSGKVSVAETIAGILEPRSGAVCVGGARIQPGVRKALEAGIGFVPRDRHREGLIPQLSVAENATITLDDRLGPLGWIIPRRRDAIAQRTIEEFAIAGSAAQRVDTLSGGNQQKVVYARALARGPAVLIAIEPTAGVDVASKTALHEQLRTMLQRGTGVVVVSDDLDDLRDCDRIIVMFNGRQTAELSRGWSDGDLIANMEGLTRV